MNLENLHTCPGTLKEGHSTYSRKCLNKVFNGRKVSHILPYNSPEVSEGDSMKFIRNREHLSISGVQEKVSLIQEGTNLRLTKKYEHGTHILKPIPHDLKNKSEVPANEHLTMQIAEQVFNINTAPNALIFFKDGRPAYITRRFDIRENRNKWGVEDFAALAEKTAETDGDNFKYNYSYEEIGDLIKKYLPTYKIEVEKYFSIVIFNYLFSNGDAHLKNFSIRETVDGDYTLSPAYDLINTKIHIDETDFALKEGLFKDNYTSEYRKIHGHPGKEDFIAFAERLGIPQRRIEKLITPFIEKQPKVKQLLNNSFLNEKTVKTYLQYYRTKRNHLSA